MRKSFYLIGVLLVLVFGGIAIGSFWMDNSESIQLQFLSWRTKPVSLGALVIICFSSGVLIASALVSGSLFSRYFEVRRLRRENSALQKMLELKDRNLEAGEKKQLAANSD